MSMSDEELKRWREIQSKYEYPVDPYGERISEDDQERFTLWEDLGLYAYLKK
jgi:hypothetical protein